MDPSALPTDNLYKFLALSGVVVTLYSVHMQITRQEDLHAKQLDVYQDTLRLNMAIDSVEHEQEALEDLREDIHSVGLDIESGSRPITPELSEHVMGQLTDMQKRGDSLGEPIAKLKQDLAGVLGKRAAQEAFEQAEGDRRWAYWAITFLGCSAMTIGFGLWYRKVQVHLDQQTSDAAREQRARADKAELELGQEKVLASQPPHSLNESASSKSPPGSRQ